MMRCSLLVLAATLAILSQRGFAADPPASQQPPATTQPAGKPADPNEAADPFHKLTFDAALKKAAAEKKVVFIDFYTTWCGPCKLLDKNTWPDPIVSKLLREHTIALRIDAEKEAKLATRYKVRGYPTLLFVRPDGSEQTRFMGYMPPREFVGAAREALKLPKEAPGKPQEPSTSATQPNKNSSTQPVKPDPSSGKP